MSAQAGPVAALEQVTLRYGKTNALDDVTLTVPGGCLVGLIGPDGVGKSSLLAIIAGARQIQFGEAQVLDGDIADPAHGAAICPRVAYMPQGLGKNLYPDLSIRENIEYFGRLFGQSRPEREDRTAELLASTGLASFAGRPAKKLSGGMKQKLGLCCSLIHDPDLLILDEPTTGVDPLSRRQFWELIARICDRRPGMGVVVATAYMEEAERFDWLQRFHPDCAGWNRCDLLFERVIHALWRFRLARSRASFLFDRAIQTSGDSASGHRALVLCFVARLGSH